MSVVFVVFVSLTCLFSFLVVLFFCKVSVFCTDTTEVEREGPQQRIVDQGEDLMSDELRGIEGIGERGREYIQRQFLSIFRFRLCFGLRVVFVSV